MNFFKRQLAQVKKEGKRAYFFRKLIVLWGMFIYFIIHLPFYFIAVPVVIVVRIIRPWRLVRFEFLGPHIGQLAANTELYLCERDAGINTPQGRRCIDFFYLEYSFHSHSKLICNKKLLSMWKRSLYIFPELILAPIRIMNRLISGWEIHEISQNTQYDRDVHNLFMRYPVHLKFTEDEKRIGAMKLRELGIPEGRPFVCLLVRDSAYLEKQLHVSNDSYKWRDANIDNYILAVKELVERGYFVIRMGVIVNKPLKINHPNVIDYAWKGLRTEFMDIYLGAKCDFCISTGSGWDTVPYIFRRPIVFTNIGSLGSISTFYKNLLTITKKYKDLKIDKNLNFKEVFSRGFGFLNSDFDFKNNGLELIENTPEEIRDVVVEMVERLNGLWLESEENEILQTLFWKIFPIDAVGSNGNPLYGKIYARFGANYLCNNREWLV